MKTWYCLDCGRTNITEKEKPKYCAFCGSENIVGEDRIKETQLYKEKLKEIIKVKKALNEEYKKVKPLNQKYLELASFFRGLKVKKIIEVEDFAKTIEGVKCKQFKCKLTEK